MSTARRLTLVSITLITGASTAAVAQEGDAVDTSPQSFRDGWAGNVSLGLFGSEGNTERLSFRAGADGTRETDAMKTVFSTVYSYAKDDGDVSDNKYRLDGRNEWFLKASPDWSVFAQGSFEFDEFQAWDTRIAGFVGVGYKFIDDEKTKLNGRVGAGASKEFGSSDNAINPEGLIGADFERQLTERQKFIAAVDIFPDLNDAGEFRGIGTAAWELLVDPDVNMSLRVGIADRYDTTPGGAKRNDLDYFAVLVWSY